VENLVAVNIYLFLHYCHMTLVVLHVCETWCLTVREEYRLKIFGNGGKGKAVPLHAMEAHGGRGGIAPTHT
jgi:hypothetical protein